jgi:hypothetical protein
MSKSKPGQRAHDELDAVLRQAREVPSAIVPAITETQTRRLGKYLAGDSLQAIADGEGRSKSAVAESLKSPAVRETVTMLGLTMTASKDDKQINLVALMLQELSSIALDAKRAVVVHDTFGSHIEYVADYRTRLDAISRLLSLVDRPTAKPSASIAQASIESEEVTRTLTATESRRRTRTAPARNGGLA